MERVTHVWRSQEATDSGKEAGAAAGAQRDAPVVAHEAQDLDKDYDEFWFLKKYGDDAEDEDDGTPDLVQVDDDEPDMQPRTSLCTDDQPRTEVEAQDEDDEPPKLVSAEDEDAMEEDGAVYY
jgi:hypothetical protein